MQITTIVLPTRPQPDTIVAIFLLKTFGQNQFPGVADATIGIRHSLAGKTFDSLLAQGVLAIDVGGGMFDHHGKDQCATELVAAHLGIAKNPALARLIQYARRDDKEGKGTLSNDPIDRAFGLSGLISSLNKTHISNPSVVVETVLPLIAAHYQAAREHHVELPEEILRRKQDGTYKEVTVQQGAKKLKVVAVTSSKPSMPTFLRSQQGPRADVVVQKAEQSNHLSILTQQSRGVDLAAVAGLIRLREAQLRGTPLKDDYEYITKTGRIDEVPMWYFDPATNSLLNGSPHNTAVEASVIPFNEIVKIVEQGLPLSSTPEAAPSAQKSYYLSAPIPEEYASRVRGFLRSQAGVKVHDIKNMHITLHYLGQQTPEAAMQFAQKTQEALANTSPFSVILSSNQLTAGSPEGYSFAWFLALNEDSGVEFLDSIRSKTLDASGIQNTKKEFHVTLATPKDKQAVLPSDSVQTVEPFEVVVPIKELVLVESTTVEGRRVYKNHTTFSLA